MYLKSREDLDLLASEYAARPSMRRSIRLELNASAADILLVIFRGLGREPTETMIDRILKREGGRQILIQCREELLGFHHFGDRGVRRACENVVFLIAEALDSDWD